MLGFKDSHSLAGQRVAVKQADQLHGPSHVPAAVENQQQVGRGIGPGAGPLADERLEQLGKLLHGDVFEKDQVQHDLVVLGDLLRVHHWRDGQARCIGQGHDPVDITHLHHGRAVDPENDVEQRTRVDVLGFSVRVQDHAALYPGIQHVVNLQLPAQSIDHLRQRSVLQVQDAGRGARRRRGRLRGRCFRLGLRLGGRRLAGLRLSLLCFGLGGGGRRNPRRWLGRLRFRFGRLRGLLFCRGRLWLRSWPRPEAGRRRRGPHLGAAQRGQKQNHATEDDP